MIFVQPDEGDQPSQRGGRFSKGQLRIGEQLVREGAGYILKNTAFAVSHVISRFCN